MAFHREIGRHRECLQVLATAAVAGIVVPEAKRNIALARGGASDGGDVISGSFRRIIAKRSDAFIDLVAGA